MFLSNLQPNLNFGSTLPFPLMFFASTVDVMVKIVMSLNLDHKYHWENISHIKSFCQFSNDYIKILFFYLSPLIYHMHLLRNKFFRFYKRIISFEHFFEVDAKIITIPSSLAWLLPFPRVKPKCANSFWGPAEDIWPKLGQSNSIFWEFGIGIATESIQIFKIKASGLRNYILLCGLRNSKSWFAIQQV